MIINYPDRRKNNFHILLVSRTCIFEVMACLHLGSSSAFVTFLGIVIEDAEEIKEK